MKIAQHFRHLRSRACFVVASGDDEFCQGCSINQRRLIEMGARHFSEPKEVWMAGGLRSIQRESFAGAENNRLHQQSKRTSSKEDLPGGVSGPSQETRDRIRLAVRVLNFSR